MTSKPRRITTGGTEKKRKEDLDAGIRIKLGDDTFTVRLGDVSPVIARKFRREYGEPFMSVMNQMDAPDIDSVAAVIWMARLIDGEDVAFDEIALSYADLEDLDLDTETADEGGGDTDPEGPDGTS